MEDFTSATFDEYEQLYDNANILASRLHEVKAICSRILGNRKRYDGASQICGAPWFVIAAIHIRESDGDWNTYLGNGDPLDKVTRDVPKGRGPFDSWEAGAADAIKIESKPRSWSLGECLWFGESFNGFGYRSRRLSGDPKFANLWSPYVWSFTTQYKGGGFPEDHVFDPNWKDDNAGVAAIFKGLAVF